MAHMKADHSPVEDVGCIAQEAGVKTLVLSHLTPGIDSISDAAWRAPAAKYSMARSSWGRTSWSCEAIRSRHTRPEENRRSAAQPLTYPSSPRTETT